jgi:DHA1 family bicyclomycin/chloramphenicol resistance-like MFS transporter
VVPYLYQDHFGLSAPDFGVWFAINSVGLWFGVQFGGLLAKYFKPQWLMVGFLAIGAGSGLYLMATAGTSLVNAEIGFFVLVFFFAAPSTIIPTIALLNHGTEAGTASSLMGGANFFATSVGAFVYTQLATNTTWDIGVWVFALFTLAVAIIIFVVRPWTIPDLRNAKPQHD